MTTSSNPEDHFDRRSNNEADQLLRRLAVNCRTQELRTRLDFACQEIILPMDGGPFQGEQFLPDRQPYVPLLYRELDGANWSEVIITGPSQSGKTLCSFVILLVYVVCELRKNVVVGVPDAAMVNDKWKVDIEPVFRANPKLAKLLPNTGPGSQGGRVTEYVDLRNGVRIKFMTRSGSDQSKAAFTASHVVVTEAAGWSEGTETSKEADPLRQLRARQRATSRFDDDGNISADRQMVIEGTVTDEEDLPWRAKPQTSESVIACPCVHCGEYVSPERQHFIGWEEAADEMEAAQIGQFSCPQCGELYTDADRTAMNLAGVMLHKGQTIDKNGVIAGDPPRTSTLWFRWSAWNNLFLKSYDLAADEWRAAQIEPETPERESAEKELCQQVWCIPYAMPLIDAAPLRRTDIRKRRSQLPPGVVPADTIKLVAGVDAGKWTCWYWVMAIRANGALQCIMYGSMGTELKSEFQYSLIHENIAIENAIKRICEIMETGFGVETGGIRPVDFTIVDAGYKPDAIYAALRGKDRKRFMPALGRGKSQMDARRYDAPRQSNSIVRRIGDRWHIEYDRAKVVFRIVFDADDSKLTVQACLRVKPGEPGALTLPMMPEKDHTVVSRHLASEVFRRWFEPGKGQREEWIKSGQNHYLDTCGMSYVAAKYLGWKIPSTVPLVQVELDEDPPVPGATGSASASSASATSGTGTASGTERANGTRPVPLKLPEWMTQ